MDFMKPPAQKTVLKPTKEEAHKPVDPPDPEPINEENRKPAQPDKFESHRAVQTVDPFDPAPLVALFDDFNGRVDAMILQADDLVVLDDKTNSKAVEMTTQAKKLNREIDKRRMEKKRPYLDVIAPLDSLCKKLSDKLNGLQRTVNGKIQPFLQKKEKARKAEEARAREEARIKQAELDKEAREEAARVAKEAEAEAKASGFEPEDAKLLGQQAASTVVAATVVVDTPKETKTETDAGSAKLKKEWVGEVTNVKELPQACIEARLEELKKAVAPWINAQVKAGIRNIPGVKVYEKASLATRARR